MEEHSRLNALLIQDGHRSWYICRACVATIGSYERIDAENPVVLQPQRDHYECSTCGKDLPLRICKNCFCFHASPPHCTLVEPADGQDYRATTPASHCNFWEEPGQPGAPAEESLRRWKALQERQITDIQAPISGGPKDG